MGRGQPRRLIEDKLVWISTYLHIQSGVNHYELVRTARIRGNVQVRSSVRAKIPLTMDEAIEALAALIAETLETLETLESDTQHGTPLE